MSVSMWRFYLVATLIVALAGSALFAHRLVASGAWKLHVTATGAPSHAQGNANDGFVVTPPPFFDGEGGWVLSALPGCFDQLSSVLGPDALMRSRVPPARDRIAPGVTLRAGNCRVYVRDADVWVFRGGDHLRVPPDARLYRTGSSLTLVYEHAGRTDVRTYRTLPAPGS